MAFVLRLYADRLAAGAECAFAPGPVRVLYVEAGHAKVAAGGATATLAADSAWCGAAAAILRAGAEGARLLRFELATEPRSDGALLTSPALALDAAAPSLIRCDRVEFPPGGCAWRHTHQGPGLRALVAGTVRIETAGATHHYKPGEAWFESGPEPVFAGASEQETTAFIRVMVLPRALLGQSSIRYVDPADKDKPRVQRYRIYLDEPTALPEPSP